jgi:hypothetical protein
MPEPRILYLSRYQELPIINKPAIAPSIAVEISRQ